MPLAPYNVPKIDNLYAKTDPFCAIVPTVQPQNTTTKSKGSIFVIL